MTTRSAHFDAWARQFLAAHPQATVLHLGCGLDSRFFRLQPGSGVEWYDVDYPEVAALRTQLCPGAEHYHVVAASVTDPAWLADIPADRPTLMIGEGLTMYRTDHDGIALLRRVIDRFCRWCRRWPIWRSITATHSDLRGIFAVAWCCIC